MASSIDRNPPSSSPADGSLSKPEDTGAQRQQRKADEADAAWDRSEKKRRDVEIQRRVKEDWRNPLT